MPERLLYDEAMLFSSIRLKIPDPDIKEGKVEMVKVQSQVGTIERPWGVEGGFAVVYKFRTASGRLRALRCFRVPMSSDTQFRYQRIEPYFQRYLSSITAGFRYHNEGILIKEQGQTSQQVYPVIEMDWIEGMTLLEKVDDCCQKRNRQALLQLSEQWLEILKLLQRAKIAHGDLAGLNVMVSDDTRLVLIDYDSAYIPDFAGMQQTILGQIDYQHPQMEQRAFNEHMDAFSALVIYLALLALALRSDLWHKYMLRKNGKLLDTNLLFTRKDFLEPHQSPLFRDLEQLDDQRVRAFTRELKRVCLQPVDEVRFPFHLIDPQYVLKSRLELVQEAVADNDDERIQENWISALEHYAPARPLLERKLLADARIAALSSFRAAVKSQKVTDVALHYNNAVLYTSPKMTEAERELLKRAHTFVDGVEKEQSDDDLLNTYDWLRTQKMTFAREQQKYIERIQKERRDIQQVRQVLQSQDIKRIGSYTVERHIHKKLKADEQQLLKLARDFVSAYSSNNDKSIIDAYDAIKKAHLHLQLPFTDLQKQRIELAQRRRTALHRFREALNSKKIEQIASAYDRDLLDSSKDITQAQRELLALAQSFTAAMSADDDEGLVKLITPLQEAVLASSLILTDEERERILLAERRPVALARFKEALATRNARMIVKAYDPIIQSKIDDWEKAIILLANNLVVKSYDYEKNAYDPQKFFNAYKRIQNEGYSEDIELLPAEKKLILRLEEKEKSERELRQKKENFENALAREKPLAGEIVEAYAVLPAEVKQSLTHREEDVVKQARRFLFIYTHYLIPAIEQDNDVAILEHYSEMQEAQNVVGKNFVDIEHGHRQRIEKAQKNNKWENELEKAFQSGDARKVITIAYDLYRPESTVLSRHALKLRRCMEDFLKTCMLTNIQLEWRNGRNGSYLHISWQWPEDRLVQEAAVLWGETPPPPLAQGRAYLEGEIRVLRKGDELEGHKAIKTGPLMPIFVHIYAAMSPYWEEKWYFSPPTIYEAKSDPVIKTFKRRI